MSTGTARKIRLGLFGGTFNPIHLGHVRAAELVQERFKLDKILFIPSYLPPHKDPEMVAAPEHRLNMVKLALAGKPGFEADALEIQAGGTSYSIRTLKQIHGQFPSAEIYFIIGVDAFLEIETWREYEKVIETCRFIVISRPGYRMAEAKRLADEKWPDRSCFLTSSSGPDARQTGECVFYLLEIEALALASTEIRERVRAGLSLEGMVRDTIAVYIKENRLYLKTND